MGVLGDAVRRASRIVTKEDKAVTLRRQAREMFELDDSQKLADWQWSEFLKAEATMDGTKTIERSLLAPSATVGAIGLGGLGVYGYSVHENGERYATYQERIDAINRQYENGEITAEKRDELLEEARNDYRRSNGDSSAGITLPEALAQMSALQLGIVAAFAIAVVVILGPPFVDAIDNFSAVKALRSR